MKANGKQIKCMVMESLPGLMVEFILESTKTTENMDTVNFFGLTAAGSKACGKTVSRTEKDLIEPALA